MNKIMDQSSVRFGFILLLTAFLTSQLVVSVSARYLPTRSQDDRLEKLRELLKDLLESDLDRRVSGNEYSDLYTVPSRQTVYKRSANSYSPTPDKMLGLGIGKFGPALNEQDTFSSVGALTPHTRDAGYNRIQKSMK